jgi:hypothetical protein
LILAIFEARWHTADFFWREASDVQAFPYLQLLFLYKWRTIMKGIRILFCFCVVGVLTTAFVSAQNGADVDRFDWPTGEPFWMMYWDGENLVSVHSYDDPNINCGDEIPEMQPGWRQVVELPNGVVQTVDHRNWYTRVMVGTEEEFWADPCLFIQTAERVAEGSTHGTYHNTWDPRKMKLFGGFTIAGPLYDLVDMCDGGMVEFNLMRKWKWSEEDGWNYGPVKGPRLSCGK